MVQRLGAVDVALQEQGREGSVDDEVVLVGFDGAGLLERALAEDRVRGAKGSQRGDDGENRQGLDFDGDGGPFREQPRLEFAVVWKDEQENRKGTKNENGKVPATQINFLAWVATSFSWYRQAPPPFIQLSSSSTSSAPSKAMSMRVFLGSESNLMSFSPASIIVWRD